MAKVGIDFGTGNTVIAILNETLDEVETLQIPEISTEMRYRFSTDKPERVIHVVPSMIYYSDTEVLIGDQVLSRGLAEHRDTFRWMKRAIAQGNSRRKKTAQGHKSAAEAGRDFMELLLRYASDRLSLENDEFTFTAPTEAFETFQNWLRSVTESLGIKRLRMLDEPTACVFGYQGNVGQNQRFAVFDHGCGTLDVSVVRIAVAQVSDRKAIQLGQAGQDEGVGGMDIDHWIAGDFCDRHALDSATRQELQALILRQAEAVKITLSDPDQSEAQMIVPLSRTGSVRVLRTTYRRECDACGRGQTGRHPDKAQSCLGCLLLANKFVQGTRETLDRALENAAVKAGVRRADIERVLVTGGTSLVPCVGKMLREYFDGQVEYQSPFDAVARGACRGVVETCLQHDYAIESYNRERKQYEFAPLFKQHTDYPTPPETPIKLWARGSYDGMTRVGLKIFEVSRMKRRKLGSAMVDEHGALREESRVDSEFSHVCLNAGSPTFIVADPPVNLARDQKRFLCSFRVDGQRRLLVTVLDNLGGKILMKDYPVVRL